MIISQIVRISSHGYQVIQNMIINVTNYIFLTCAAHYCQACLYLPTRAATSRTRVQQVYVLFCIEMRLQRVTTKSEKSQYCYIKRLSLFCIEYLLIVFYCQTA